MGGAYRFLEDLSPDIPRDLFFLEKLFKEKRMIKDSKE